MNRFEGFRDHPYLGFIALTSILLIWIFDLYMKFFYPDFWFGMQYKLCLLNKEAFRYYNNCDLSFPKFAN